MSHYDATRKSPNRPGQQPMSRIGRFNIVKVLGEGAFGRVYLAFDEQLERQVAIKVPHREGLTPEFRDRFLREARATAKIHHPNVCPVHEVGTEGDLPYIVMHYVVGSTLSALLERLRAPMPPRHALAIARKLALGMSAAHAKGVVHRDLKPANVLYEASSREVLITDFGLALMAADTRLTADGAVYGTPAYMSPEQAKGRVNEIGPLSDVYSLGVIFYRMLTGAAPFTGSVYEVMMQHADAAPQFPSVLCPGLDPRLDAIVLKAMAKRPADRYSSAKAFADALGTYLRADGRPESDAELPFATMLPDEPTAKVQSQPAARKPLPAHAAPAKRRRGRRVFAGLFVLLLAAGGAAAWWRADLERLFAPRPDQPAPDAASPTIEVAPPPRLKDTAARLVGKWERPGKKENTIVWEFTKDGKLTWSTSPMIARTYKVTGDQLPCELLVITEAKSMTYTITDLTDEELKLRPPKEMVKMEPMTFKRLKP